ncbi:MAG: ribulokinase [Candidatus Sumerlaeota bacterium]|nr:ribulokinase [Candidatus Sumerlaeota bacterium]
MPAKYALGLDFGTNSVRALIVNCQTGEEIATHVHNFPSGEAGIILDRKDPNLARQHPRDYLVSTEAVVNEALKKAKRVKGFKAADVIGIGIDTTGSTPMPVDADGTPLALKKEFAKNPAAMAWLWKDHTGHAEAAEITALAAKIRPQYLAKCGGTYSSEWFWSKILHCARTAPQVFGAAHTWVEHSDWMPAVLTGTAHPEALKRDICAAGHKAMFNPGWKGYPDEEFLWALDKRLARMRKTLPHKAYNVSQAVGALTAEWAKKLGLPAGIAVAAGAFDAHLGGVGSGIRPGTMVKNIGTSTCDMMVAPLDQSLPDIPGLCGIVPESILPGCFGLEAGQSAVGDIFNWFVNYLKPDGQGHAELTRAAEKLRPGQSGLLALDWHNGNRTILVDQRLTGGLIGMTLHTTPAEMYRAWVEATAFGARVIMERFEEYGQKVERIVNCGGISAKNPMVMQIYADVMGRPLEISRSAQTAALGSAMAGAVVAGKAAGGHENFAAAIQAMTGVQKKVFRPIADNVKVYHELFALYRRLHDAFGVRGGGGDLYDVMKELLRIRDQARGG